MPRRIDAEVRAPGRPRLDPNDVSVDVHLTVPSKDYDRLYRESRRERTTIQELIRRALHTAELVDDETE